MRWWRRRREQALFAATASLIAAARRREPNVDVIAWLALVGALWVGAAFAGARIAVMLASGVLPEARAAARARRELSGLASRAIMSGISRAAHSGVIVEGSGALERLAGGGVLRYGRDASLRLHNAQEEEGAFSLVPDPRTP